MPISVITKLECDPGENAEMEAALKEMQTAVKENEPGTTFFLIHRSRKDPQVFYIIEQYENEAMGEQHGSSDAFHAAVEKLTKTTSMPAEHVGLDLIE